MSGPGSPSVLQPSPGLSLSVVGSFQHYAESAASNDSSPVFRFNPFAAASSSAALGLTDSLLASPASASSSSAAAAAGRRFSFSSVHESPTPSDFTLDSPVRGPVTVGQGVDLGSESPVVAHNPLAAVVDHLGYNPFLADPVEAFEVDPASWCLSSCSASMNRFEAKFDGHTNGLAADEHLDKFFKFQRSMVPGSTDQLARLTFQLTQFADSYEHRGSRFHSWALDKLGPILLHLDQSSQNSTTAARNQSYQAALALWQAAVNDYRATVCKATQAELTNLLSTPCPDINAVRNLVIKFRALYSLADTQAVPSEDTAVCRFLNNLRCIPALVNVANGLLAALQALPALPNGGNYTFANVSNELERMTLMHDADAAAFL
jgi:hypothetical protein